MSLLDIVVIAISLGLAGAGAYALPRMWRDDWKWDHDVDEPPSWWAWGRALWRGGVRATPLAVAMFAVLGPWMLLEGAADAAWLLVVADVLVGLFTAIFVMVVSVVLVNRPKSVVVPHRRDQLGALAEWRAGVRTLRRPGGGGRAR